jgi:hypothetical protein
MRLTPLLLFSCAFCAVATAQDTRKVHGTIRLGSWNIEHLGDPKARRGPGEGIEQRPADLAHYLRHARLDLFAVQEINADADAPQGFPRRYRTNSLLTKTLAELNRRPGYEWKHVLFPKMNAGDTGQWTGIAWNAKKLTPKGDIFQIPVSHIKTMQGSNKWDRNCHAMMFSAGEKRTDFAVMVLHLKANVNGSFAGHREEEVKDLVGRLPGLEKPFPKERDLVFVGDTNMEDVKEPGSLLLEKAGFRNLNTGIDTHTAREVQPFDRIFVPRDQPEFMASRLESLSDFQKNEGLSFFEYRKRYSDHYIIVTEIKIMDDDD